MKSKKIEEWVREYIRFSEGIIHHTQKINELEVKRGEIRSLLFKDRSKEYIEGVLCFLSERKGEYQQKDGYNELVSQVQHWCDSYEKYVPIRLKHMSPEQLAMFEGKVE